MSFADNRLRFVVAPPNAIRSEVADLMSEGEVDAAIARGSALCDEEAAALIDDVLSALVRGSGQSP